MFRKLAALLPILFFSVPAEAGWQGSFFASCWESPWGCPDPVKNFLIDDDCGSAVIFRNYDESLTGTENPLPDRCYGKKAVAYEYASSGGTNPIRPGGLSAPTGFGGSAEHKTVNSNGGAGGAVMLTSTDGSDHEWDLNADTEATVYSLLSYETREDALNWCNGPCGAGGDDGGEYLWGAQFAAFYADSTVGDICYAVVENTCSGGSCPPAGESCWNGAVGADVWYSLAARHNTDTDDTIVLFVDGDQKCDDPTPACGTRTTIHPTTAGNRANFTSGWAENNDKGEIQEFAWFRRAFTDDEIVRLCRCGLEGTGENLASRLAICNSASMSVDRCYGW